jgi:beta-lactam-binding protein with PASTA domain
MVADVATLTFEQAQQRLAEDSLVAVAENVYDLDVAPGLAVGTDPPAGSRLDKNATVTVLISQGPQPQTVQALAGTTAADARGILQAINLTVSDPDQEYFTDEPEDTVIGVSVTPRAGGEPVDCTQGCNALEGDTATLSVSVGPVPDVYGQSVDAATAALAEKGLSVTGTADEFRDDLEAGLVVYIAERDGGGNWRPGESVTLVVSAGPPLFPVPNVVGLTRDQAKAALTDAGFDYEYATLWDAVLDEITEVESQVPAAGTQHPKGTVVSFRINGAF